MAKTLKINTILAAGMMMWMSVAEAANPLCASPEERQSIQTAFAASPKSTPALIAREIGIAEAAVVHGLPAEHRTAVPIGEFEALWQRLTEWDDALVIALSSDSVFEMFGPLPAGSVDRGYFNFDEPDSPYGGHLKIERLAAIYLLSTHGRNGETHQIAFFDEEGRRVFSVYVPRDDEGALRTQPHNQFLRLKRDYDALNGRSSIIQTDCLWALVDDREVEGEEQ